MRKIEAGFILCVKPAFFYSFFSCSTGFVEQSCKAR